MQQTQTYQLNKIDVDDNFSPVPLNENMDKVEAKFAALDGADAALDSRVTALEGHKVAVGSYIGSSITNGVPQTITLGFQPQVVYIYCARLGHAMATQDHPYRINCVLITENGFSVMSDDYSNMNHNKDVYLYLAIK